MNKISLGLLAAGGLLCLTTFQGWNQERWINAQNKKIAIATATQPRQHNSPLWPLLGITGLGMLGAGAIRLQSKLPESEATPVNPLSDEGLTGLPNPESTPAQQMRKNRPLTAGKSPNSDSTDWLKHFFDESYHVALNGATRSGKTTLCEWGISQLGDTEVYLIDPKYNPQKPRWNYTPYCTDIDEVTIHLDLLSKRIKSRLNGEEVIAPLNIILDEWDWVKETHGKPVVKTLRKIFKVGAELQIKLWLLGQSPLAQDTGLSGSDYRNFGRVVLTSEALAFINNQQFPWSASDYKPLAVSHQKRGDRFGLFIPMSGEPFIKVVPDLSQFSPVQRYQLESSPHPPERSGDDSEPSDSEWLNAMLKNGYTTPERLNDWEPRDPLNDSEPSSEAIGMVVSLHRSGCSKQETIEYTWKCKKGGSKAYKKAVKFYEQTLQNLGAN